MESRPETILAPILAVCDSPEGCGFVYPSGITTGEAWWVDDPAPQNCPVCGRQGHIPESFEDQQAALDALTDDQGKALLALLVVVAEELGIDPARPEVEVAKRSILNRLDPGWASAAIGLASLIYQVLHGH
jgi:hypothetical protein